jgi:hypothetical protein
VRVTARLGCTFFRLRPRIFLYTLAMLNAGAAAAMARGPHLGTPEVITSFSSGESNIIASSSLPGHGDAYAVFHRIIGRNLYTVVFRDEQGHAHKFDIPTTNGSYPMAIRFAGLEDGGGMALWDDGANHRILARSWSRDGTLAASQSVLAQVTTSNNAGFGSAQWQISSDGTGTVVVATTGMTPDAAGRVFATVRDPGRPFGAPQELTPANEPAIIDRQILVSPITSSGTVAVSWGPVDVAGPGGRAIRSGRSPRFDAPTVVPFGFPLGLTKTNRSILAPDATPITIDASVAHFCPCRNTRVLTWGGDVRVLAFQTTGGNWYVARAGRDRVYTSAVKATEHAGSVPMRRARPGEVGFARFDTEADNNLFRQHSRLVVIPFGSKVPASRRAPRLRFGTYARAADRHLLVPVYCDRVCAMHGSSGPDRRLRMVDFRGRRVDPSLEPFTVRYLRVALPAPHLNARVTARASDDAGHRATARATFVRGKRGAFWCLSTKPRC